MESLESNGHDSLSPASRGDDATPSGGHGGVALLVWLAELARGAPDGDAVDDASGDGFDEPRTIGPFRLDGLLGRGGYGAVFRAFDTELERTVALKVAWPHVMFDRISARRFIEEPKTAAALDHPGIIKIYRSGWVDAVCFIAFELVEGPTLREWLDHEEHVPFNLAAEIIACVADAVQFAHDRGIIHRDLKPRNILLKPRPGDERFPYHPTVGDFGLASRVRPLAMSTLTGTRDVIGTDPYVAPEQLDGGKGKAEPTSDVFSLGVILYEVIAGRRPFDSETAEETRSRISTKSRRRSARFGHACRATCRRSSPSAYKNRPRRGIASAGNWPTTCGVSFTTSRSWPAASRRWQRAWKYAKRKPLVVSFVSVAAASVMVVAGLLER